MKRFTLIGAFALLAVASLAYNGYTKSDDLHAAAVNTADLSVLKQGPSSIAKGGVITYTLIAKNKGPSVAQAVTLTDAVPTGLTFVAAGSSTACKESDGIVLCQLGNLADQQQVNSTVKFQLSATLCGTISNTVVGSTQTQDTVTTNNTSSVQTTITGCPPPSADVSVTKTGPATIVRGNAITYTVVAKNNGPDAAKDVMVTDAVPAGMTYIDAESSSLCDVSDDIVLCNIGTLNKTQQQLMTLKFQIAQNAVCGNKNNTAVVSSTTQDPTSTNNTATAVTNITGCPSADVSITKTAPASATYGKNLTYQMTVKNNGPDSAQEVTVTDAVPANMEYNDSASFPGCFDSGDSIIVCPIGTLTPQQVKNFLITFVPRTCEGVSNTAVVSTTTRDYNSANDTSTAVIEVSCPAQ